jgi:hypothetical protein
MDPLEAILNPIAPIESMMSRTLSRIGTGAAGNSSTTSSPLSSAYSGLESAFRAEGIGGEPKMSKLASTLGTIGSGVGILGDLAGIYLGFKAQKEAKKQFAMQTKFANANLGNTVDAYNTRLKDIYTTRGYTQGDSSQKTQDAITSNSLKFRQV